MHEGAYSGHETQREYLASRFCLNNYRFVPLVLEELGLICSLHILYLRAGKPGNLVHVGDIDNRMKVVIDALKMPAEAKELGTHDTPGPDEDPFFCLLQDDKLVSHLAIETDTLLESIGGGNFNPDDARLIITVTISPTSNINLENLAFI